VANRTNPLHEANRLTSWQLQEIGREVRVARLTAGKTQRGVASSVGTSIARISRIERGLVSAISVRQLGRVAASVGLKLYIRAFPAMRRLLDQPQIDLLTALRERASPAWRWRVEVPIPIAGDLRAADAVATIPGCSVLVELWTRLADWQAQSRAALLKQRDLGAQRLLIVLKATHANREAVRQAGSAARASLPLGSREILRALADGRDPGDNGILFL
jgi:transcriptional regulator with XRE-family HTH domain